MMFVEQRDARWWFALNGATRLALVRGALNVLGKQLVVTEYPKSGGTWLSQMIAAATGMSYPRNRLPHFGKQLLHGHYLEVSKGADTIVVWRDFRDIMVSYYYHLIFEKPITSAKYSRKLNAHLGIEDPKDIQKNLPKFMEWSFNGGYPGFTWADFVDRWFEQQDVHHTSYEKVRTDPLGELIKAVTYLEHDTTDVALLEEIVADHSFENQSARKPGKEDVTKFVRKGIIGDWKNVFTQEAREVFNHHAGKELVTLGYEKDTSWVDGH